MMYYILSRYTNLILLGLCTRKGLLLFCYAVMSMLQRRVFRASKLLLKMSVSTGKVLVNSAFALIIFVLIYNFMAND